ncbi:hypothetical protein TEGL_21800 [Terrisporobacter glycolicus ATCC 14880 = DSM 1288]|uniref:ABC-2 family transporter protein n=1 Tax=Terrisporobacter glycolicus ATCC 14880 = DSM 1288 TaxID=1121315 RepID=A0ABZ2EWA0_9FIRM|nr:hypothetical protein [Terrisporobacter glycolicus]
MKKHKIQTLETKYKNIDDDKFEDLLEEDLKEIENFLDSYIVPEVNEYKIEATIDVLRDYMPVTERKHKVNLYPNVKSSLELIKLNLTFVSKLYWFLSLLLVLLGTIITVKFEFNIYETAISIAPIPILLGVFELIKGRDESVWEIELSYKYSLREILLSKIIIIGVFSIGIGLIISILLTNTYSSVNILKMLVLWLIPIFLTSSVSLVIVSIYRSINSIAICLSIWILSIILMNNIQLNISHFAELAVLALSFITMIYSLRLFYKQSINFYDYQYQDL